MPVPALADQAGANEEDTAARASELEEIVVAATRLYNARAGYTIRNLDLTFFCNKLANGTPALSRYQAIGTSNLVLYTTFSPTTVSFPANVSF